MTTIQKTKVLERIVVLERDIEKLKRVRMEIAESGYASATMSSGGGSKSYTRTDLSKIQESISQMQSELKGLRSLLKASTPAMPSKIVRVYC